MPLSSNPPGIRPPSEPIIRTAVDATGALKAYERPGRWQMAAAIVLGVILIGVPLYLWQRPRSVTEPVARETGAIGATALATATDDAGAAQDAGVGVLLADPRILECSDPGSKRPPAEPCDHVASFEKSFAQLILDARDCVPLAEGSGTITYVADLSFTRRRAPVTLSLPKDARSIRSSKVVATCAGAVRRGLGSISLDGLPHDHAHYKISIAAMYPGPR